MHTFLRDDFVNHHIVPPAAAVGATVISERTNESYFELADDNTLIHFIIGNGCAVYQNNNRDWVRVINYEGFINSLPATFQNNRRKCDLIVFTESNQNYFLLNELTDTLPQYVDDFTNSTGLRTGKRNTAITQLTTSLTDLLAVPTIRTFADGYTNKHCVFFNKQVLAPTPITATASFNLLNTISTTGLQLKNLAIEALGFTLWEYSGGKVFIL